MPICSPGVGEDRRICGFSPRGKAENDGPDDAPKPMHYRPPSFSPRSHAVVMDQLLDKVSLLAHRMASLETNLGERMASLENTLIEKAQDKEKKQNNADKDLSGMSRMIALVEGLPDALRVAADVIAQENSQAHARLQELLHPSADGFPSTLKATTDAMLQDNVQANVRLQELLDRLENHTESSIHLQKGQIEEIKDEIVKVKNSRMDLPLRPEQIEVVEDRRVSARTPQRKPMRLSTEQQEILQHGQGSELTPKTPKTEKAPKIQQIMTMHGRHLQEHAVETLRHLTATEKVKNEEVAKERSILESTKALCHKYRHPPNNQLTQFVEGDAFGFIASLAIIANTCVLGLQTNDGVERSTVGDFDEPGWFRAANLSFAVFFTGELVLRLMAERFAFFVGSNWYWNLFDTAMVLTALLELLSTRVDGTNYTFFRVLKVFRMFRAVRILRVFRYVRDLRLMVVSIAGSFIALFWAFLLLFILIFCCAVLICEDVAAYYQDEWHNGVSGQKGLKQFYGSVPMTMYTLLMAISGGADWYDLVRPLSQVSDYLVGMFVAYTLFVVFGMLNVLTGIFVDRASETSHLDRDLVIDSEKRKVETFSIALKKVFKEMDEGRDGFITWPEFESYCHREDVKRYFESVELSLDDTKDLFRMLDNRHSGQVSIDDFINGCLRLKGQAKALDLLQLQQNIDQVKHLVVLNAEQMVFLYNELTAEGTEELLADGVPIYSENDV